MTRFVERFCEWIFNGPGVAVLAGIVIVAIPIFLALTTWPTPAGYQP